MHKIFGVHCSKIAILLILSICGLVVVSIRTMFTSSIYTAKDVPMICLQQLLVACIQVAKRGGHKVREVRQKHNMQVRNKGETAEGMMEPVTEGDLLSHKQMYFSLMKMWPELLIVSEEKSNFPPPEKIKPLNLSTDGIVKLLASNFHKDVRLEDVTVWIDPLDATYEYTEDLMEYVTTMVCVAHKGVPIIGVIHRPFQKETIWAWKGHGRSDIPYFNKNIDSINKGKMKIIVSRSHAGEVKELSDKVFGKNVEIISAGGAGYKSLKVAQRNANVYIHTTAIKKWDVCAGNALLRTVGGQMTDLNGQLIDYSYPSFSESMKINSGLLATFRNHHSILRKIKYVRAKEMKEKMREVLREKMKKKLSREHNT